MGNVRSACWAALLLTWAMVWPVGAADVAATRTAAMLPVDGRFYPATIFFGAYNFNEQLIDRPADWTFVQQHMDGMLLHFGFWLNNDQKKRNPDEVGAKLAAIVNPLHKQFLVEVGWPRGDYSPDVVSDIGHHFADEFARKILAFEAATGIHIDVIETELRLFIFRQIAQRYPTFGTDAILAQLTGRPPATPATHAYWPEYLSAMRARLGNRIMTMGCPPIYVPWDGLIGFGKDLSFVDPADAGADGRPRPGARTMTFEGPALFDGIFATNTSGFVCDSPYSLMRNPKYVSAGYLVKLLRISHWLHDRKKSFSFIVNGPPAEKDLSHDQWDQKFEQNSLASLQMFQRMGGRADRYLLESWYQGPYNLVPESQPGSMTHLAKQAILYLDGIDQRLNLTLTLPDGSNAAGAHLKAESRLRLTISNRGDVDCLPALRLRPTSADMGAKISIDGVDSTAMLGSEEGWTAAELLPAGESATMDVSISGGAGQGSLELMWNPQDPSDKPRDTISMLFDR